MTLLGESHEKFKGNFNLEQVMLTPVCLGSKNVGCWVVVFSCDAVTNINHSADAHVTRSGNKTLAFLQILFLLDAGVI